MRMLAGMAVLAVALVLAGLGFMYSGIYNVAATQPHFAIVWWALDTTKKNSIERHAADIAPPDLDDGALVARGAGQYHAACVSCHGAPGVPRGQMGQGVNPTPPDLSAPAMRWSDAELFWIVKYGIKYAGMPAWGPTHRDDEIWALVAFTRRLPDMTPAAYAQLTRGTARREVAGIAVAEHGGTDPAAAACAICHGADAAGRNASEVPRLAGQHERYLYDTLRRFADGTRPSGIMAPIAGNMTDAEMRAVAGYYAATPRGAPAANGAEPMAIQRGGAISAAGLPDQGVAPCASCHGKAGISESPEIPVLAGQHAPYLGLQLALWKAGLRTDQPMRDIAARLTDEQIAALAAYFASVHPSVAAR